MDNKTAILAIDQGTTSSRAIVFDTHGHVLALAQREFAQIYPNPGWVEHDPEAIWQSVTDVVASVVAEAKGKGVSIAACGITNQRETTIIWDRKTGEPIHNAIVWQDRRTADVCKRLVAQGHEPKITKKTGLVCDPYFSASKIAWILDHVKGARKLAKKGRLAFGTIDSFLVWRLTGGQVHAMDATNASRTSLYNIQKGAWDPFLLKLFNVPKEILPEVRGSTDSFGAIADGLAGAGIPICGIAGDQQAAAFGLACFAPGDIKCTYGTGAFMMANTGSKIVHSSQRLLSTIAWQIGDDVAYALEGSILCAGASMQWLRDGLGLFDDSAKSAAMAAKLEDNGGVYMIPAFTGLGAPWWDAEARGAILGLTRGASAAHIVRAGLEAAAYQSVDLLDAMRGDGVTPQSMKVDGGMARNDWLMQFLSDVTALEVLRPANAETTAFGAAALAGLGAGIYPDKEAIAKIWQAESRFAPAMSDEDRRSVLAGWHTALARVRQ